MQKRGRIWEFANKEFQGNGPRTSSQQTDLDWRVAFVGSNRGLEDKKDQEKNISFKLCIYCCEASNRKIVVWEKIYIFLEIRKTFANFVLQRGRNNKSVEYVI